MVGAVRFELTTSCTRNKRASQATLRPEPREPENARPKPELQPSFSNNSGAGALEIFAAFCKLAAFPGETGSRVEHR